MTKRKKGQVLLYGAIAGLIGAIIVLAVNNAIASRKDFNIIGSSSLTLLKISKEAEKVLFYLDQSAKYSLQQSIYELAQNGGTAIIEHEEGLILQPQSEQRTEDRCGTFDGYNVWYKLVKYESGIHANPCFDNNQVEANLLYLFKKNLNNYLLNHPYNIPFDYSYERRGNLEVIGYAITPLKFDILKDETKAITPKPKEVKIQIGAKEKAEAKPIEEKPTEAKTPKAKIPIEVKELKGIDFTGIPLCAKGVTCILTEDAYRLLLKANEEAKKRFEKYLIKYDCLKKEDVPCLQVNSAYRSYEQQKALWEGRTPDKYAQKYPDPKIRRKYVSNPDECGNYCSHFDRKAIDIVFYGKTTKTMTHTDWLILHEIMTSVKNDKNEPEWVRYGDEKRFEIGERWHFECCGTNRHARAIKEGVTAIV